MDTTPKGKSLKFVRSNDNKQRSNTSPAKEAKKQRFWNNDHDSQENNDVLWDWDSPKNIRPKALKTKRRDVHKSPILASKKTSQMDHIKNYERLKQELQALRDEIARTDDCLPLSPVDEQILKEESEDTEINSFIEEQYFHIENQEIEACLKTDTKHTADQGLDKTVVELFDDGCDEQLFMCTQRLEEKLYAIDELTTNDLIKINRKSEVCTQMLEEKLYAIDELPTNDYIKINGKSEVFNDDINIKNIVNIDSRHNPHQSKLVPSASKSIPDNLVRNNLHTNSIDDSFDAILLEFDDEEINILSQASNKNVSSLPNTLPNKTAPSSTFKRTISDANVQYTSNLSKNLNLVKSEFHRTQSFESAPIVKNSVSDNLPKHVVEQIERKRREALARLLEKREEKRIPITPTNSSTDNSIMTCSPDEIEKKRLQAKAIREAKQRQLIEKNRQEAMRKLEMKRRRNNEKSHVRTPL